MAGPRIRSRRARSLALAAAVPVVLAACGGAGNPASGVVVRDSAGIQIVENHRPAWADGAAWHVAASPTVSIGTLDGPPETQLYQVAGATRLSDGRIVVLNAGTQELRFYSPEGDHRTTAGGTGEGPGEFVRPTSLHRLADDSLLVNDFSADRLSIFDAEGRFIRDFRLASVDERRASAWFALGTNALVGSTTTVFRASELSSGVPDGTRTLVSFTMDGEPLDTLGEFPVDQRYVWTDGASIAVLTYPFARGLHRAAADEIAYLGWSEHYELFAYRTDGRIDRIIRRSAEPAPIGEAEIERAIELRLADTEDAATRRRQESMYRDVPYPATLPAFDDLVVDAVDHLWVRRVRFPWEDGPTEWEIYDPDGRWLGTVATPAGLDVYEIGTDYVLGRMQDELEVERIVLLELVRAQG